MERTRLLPVVVVLALLGAGTAIGLAGPGLPVRGATTLDRSVAEPALQVGIDMSPTQGLAPLTVTFTAVATGGSGSYTEYRWSMGDGGQGVGRSLKYTYERAGDFAVTVNVTDSAGDHGLAEVAVTVGAPASPAAGSGYPSTYEDLGLLAGAVGAAGVGVVLWRRRTRSVPRGEPPSEPPAGSPISPPRAPPSDLGAGANPPDPRATLASVPKDTLRLSERMILHLARQPALDPHGIGTRERTQGGMIELLAASQSAVSNVLVRLSAAGVVSGRSRHVSGLDRRVKVYELTTYGHEVARQLRLRATPGAPTGQRSPPPRD